LIYGSFAAFGFINTTKLCIKTTWQHPEKEKALLESEGLINIFGLINAVIRLGLYSAFCICS
jgi:hypothetical protein